MLKAEITTQTFTKDNGEIVPFKRLLISGYVDSILRTVEIKLDKETLNHLILLDSIAILDAPEVVQVKSDDEPIITKNSDLPEFLRD